MNPQEVAHFLLQNPLFFEEHASLLADIRLPHPNGEQVISLTERQLHSLRERVGKLQKKLAELVTFGEENDAINQKIHRFSLTLLKTKSFDALTQAINMHLQGDFAVPHVALRIWNAVPLVSSEFSSVSESFRSFAADLKTPYCGPAHHEEVLKWFGDAAQHLRSLALIPLRCNGTVLGMLALGSEDSQRFFPEMGTLYIARIGELIGAALAYHIEPNA